MSGGLGKSTLTSTTANNGYFNDLHFGQSGALCSKCNAWKGELGLEPSFNLYLDHLIQIFAEVKRVVKDTGSIFVVLGDTYAGSGGAAGHNEPFYNKSGKVKGNEPKYKQTKPESIAQKSLCKIPQRFCIRMIDELGLVNRNDLIWYKPNCMPSSAKDRFTVDYEHVFFFVKSRKYYFETQYEPYQGSDWTNWKTGNLTGQGVVGKATIGGKTGYMEINRRPSLPNSLGRLKRCVWKIPTAPFKDAHFATFPPALVEPMIKAGCPTNGFVLDPFCGSGTVGLVAAQNARNFTGIEINGDYVEMARKRLQPWLMQSRLSI